MGVFTYDKLEIMFTWWRHLVEIFSALLARCPGYSPITGEFPAQRPVTRSFDVLFDLRLNNNREAGDWRRYRAHYDVIVMSSSWFHLQLRNRVSLVQVCFNFRFVT